MMYACTAPHRTSSWVMVISWKLLCLDRLLMILARACANPTCKFSLYIYTHMKQFREHLRYKSRCGQLDLDVSTSNNNSNSRNKQMRHPTSMRHVTRYLRFHPCTRVPLREGRPTGKYQERRSPHVPTDAPM